MDSKYCYPNTNVLKNKQNKRTLVELSKAEVKYTSLRLYQLQDNPIKGKFDFQHLKKIHHFIFQDLYDWAGKSRTVDIGKGNLFCRVQFIDTYANEVFKDFYSECYESKGNAEKFVSVLVKHYADLNALHPFREGNGRTQREFTRELCEKCGYIFDLSCASHADMLEASMAAFNTGDNTKLFNIFTKAVVPRGKHQEAKAISILTQDDLQLADIVNTYEYTSENKINVFYNN